MTEIIEWSAVETAAAVEAGEVSVREVVAAHVARMQICEPALNAVVEPMAEAALAEADAKDAGRPEDVPPLWGVPVTIKVNVDLEGYATNQGVPALNSGQAPADAAVVRNLRDAGAVVIGRTSTPEFSLRWFTSNPIYGVTRNPWDAGITPGGSSGGASAAVAAGVGCLGHGNDLGGSLRYPAYAVGGATLRPSMGRVPAFNPGATVERGAVLASMSVQGVIARNVGDVRAALPSLSRGDWRDPLWREAPVDAPLPKRVGVCSDPFGDGVAGPVVAAVEAAGRAAEAAGYEVVEIVPPQAAECAEIWGRLLVGEADLLMRPGIEAYGSDAIKGVMDGFREAFGTPDMAQLVKDQTARMTVMRAWAGMFQEVDALILPVSSEVPFALEQDVEQPETFQDILRAQRALYIVNLLGLPAACVRTFEAAPVPLGVQVVGPMMGDEACLDVAAGIEAALGFDLRPILPRG